MNNIQLTQKLGQQIWLDNLSRSLLKSKRLKQFVEVGVTGITTNPSIFSQAIENDVAYEKSIEQLHKQNLAAKDIYEMLAIQDVQDACDEMSKLYQTSQFQYGYVSMELDPRLANEYDASIKEAHCLWQKVNRPNLMLKVPATPVGTQICESLIACGMNVNVTLIFSLQQARQIYEAYYEGLKNRVKASQAIDSVRAVASFFVSRIDTALDLTLPTQLQGQVAIALAKQAYQEWLAFFNAEKTDWITAHRGTPLWLLWASTGTKNPQYSNVLYVDSLIGKNTVNTLPEKTLTHFLDHGQPSLCLEENAEQAGQILKKIQSLDISLEKLAIRLQQDGILQFEAAFQKILNYLG